MRARTPSSRFHRRFGNFIVSSAAPILLSQSSIDINGPVLGVLPEMLPVMKLAFSDLATFLGVRFAAADFAFLGVAPPLRFGTGWAQYFFLLAASPSSSSLSDSSESSAGGDSSSLSSSPPGLSTTFGSSSSPSSPSTSPDSLGAASDSESSEQKTGHPVASSPARPP